MLYKFLAIIIFSYIILKINFNNLVILGVPLNTNHYIVLGFSLIASIIGWIEWIFLLKATVDVAQANGK
jgi:hypothetical protein